MCCYFVIKKGRDSFKWVKEKRGQNILVYCVFFPSYIFPWIAVQTSGADGSEHIDLPDRKPSASRCWFWYVFAHRLGVMCDLLTGNCLVLVSHSISATELCLVMPFCLGARLIGIYTSAKCIDYMSALICKHIAFTWKKHKPLGMGASLWIFQTAGVCSGGGLGSHICPAAQGWEETSFPSAGRGFASLWKSYCILKYNMTVSFWAFKLFLKAAFSLTDCCI